MEYTTPEIFINKIEDKGPEVLNEHKILGLFYNLSSNKEKCILYAEQYKKQWVHNQIISEELESINRTAIIHNTEAVLLKGCHLLLTTYKDSGSRFMADIDLYLPETEIKNWEIVLKESGYALIHNKKFYGNSFKQDWSKLIENIEINIELHTKLFYHLKTESWETENTNRKSFSILKKEDFFIHLCGHFAFQHNFSKLYWLFDIYFYYQQNHTLINWKILKERSKNKKLNKSVQICLWLLKKHFNITFPDHIETLFELRKKYLWKILLNFDFLTDPYGYKIRYLVIKHISKDNLSYAFYYDLAWIFQNKVMPLIPIKS